MSPTSSPDESTRAAEQAEAGAPHDADRAPTPDEERAAEEAAAAVDLDEVARHEQEMTELGANVEGEGQIVPD